MGKSKKQLAWECINQVTKDLPNGGELAAAIVQAIEILTEPQTKRKNAKSDGSLVWEAYEAAIGARHGFRPQRNATVNNQACQLVARLGLENAIAVVQFYVVQNDAFYLRNMHPLGFCLKDCEALFGRWKTGKSLTRKAADKIESAAATLGASSTYLTKKYGQPNTPGEETP